MGIMANATTMMEKWQENYHYVFTELRDPRVDGWLFMSSPWPVLSLCAVYYYIVRYAGPAFMKDRPPYDIQKLMIAYNFFQTLLSLWVFQKACYFWLTGRYNWLCQPVDYSNTEEGMLAADMTWWYFFSKFIDYLDSFFFVLRKKWSHLSTVHVVMYFYYLMSAMGPSVQKYLWWKRYLTTMQLGQFVTFFVHASLPLFIECDFPKIFSYVILFHGAMFFLLFANFYRQTYTKKSKSGTAKKTDVNGNGVVKKDE